MFSYQTKDAIECFENAKHLNAAVKKIMKSEAARDPKTARFTKALRAALKSPKAGAIAAFIEKAQTDYEQHLFLVVRNAYAPLIEPILDSIIEAYSENFNATYEVDAASGKITVTSEDSFRELGKEAIKSLEQRIEASELPSNGFMKQAVLYSLFDLSVLEALEQRLQSLN